VNNEKQEMYFPGFNASKYRRPIVSECLIISLTTFVSTKHSLYSCPLRVITILPLLAASDPRHRPRRGKSQRFLPGYRRLDERGLAHETDKIQGHEKS